MTERNWRKGALSICIGEKELKKAATGQRIVAQGKYLFYLRIVMIVALHLKTLAQVHQALIDFPSLRQSCPRRLCIPGTFGPLAFVSLKSASIGSQGTYQPDQQ